MKCTALNIHKDTTPCYQHKHLNKELHIEKDGVGIVLNDVEIVQVLKCLDAITSDSIDAFNIEKAIDHTNNI